MTYLRAACLLFLALGACHRTERVSEQEGGSGLMRNLMRAARVEIFSAEGDLADACRELAGRYELEHDGLEMRVLPYSSSGDKRAARIFVGSLKSPDVLQLARRVGVRMRENGGFTWSGRVFDSKSSALLATFQDPERPGLPLTILCGNQVEGLLPYLTHLRPYWRPFARGFQAGNLVLDGPLSLSGTLEVGTVQHHGQARRKQLADFRIEQESDGLRCAVDPDVPTKRGRDYVAAAASARDHVLSWADPGGAPPSQFLILFASCERMASLYEVPALARVNPINRDTSVLLSPGLPHDWGAGPARAAALSVLGPAHAEWLEDGAAVDAAGQWWGRPLDVWLAWLLSAGLVPAPAEIVDRRASRTLSPHVLIPARAALLRFLRSTHGDVHIRRLWSGAIAFDGASDASGFSAWLEQRVAPRMAALEVYREKRRGQVRDRLEQGALIVGAGLSELGEKPERAYGSSHARDQLDELKEAGADAVSFESFLAPLSLLDALGGSSAGFGAIGGDASLADCLGSARRRRMFTMLKPHLLSSPGGTWLGSLSFSTEEEWHDFFDTYQAFLVHYALLAELMQCDLLCIGSSMPGSTSVKVSGRTTPEQIVLKEEGWVRVIDAARSVFSGGLTYSATPVEARELGFWSQLDAVGLDFHPNYAGRGMRQGSELDGWLQSRLERTIDEFCELANEVQRPALLTQVGFVDIPPDRGTLGREPATGGDLQRRMFQAFSATLDEAVEAYPRLRGFFLWRFSTDPEHGGSTGSDPMIQGRPAEAVARKILADF